jgi:hypothetical protein
MKYVMGSDGNRDTAEFVGEWRHNLRHGTGEMTWSSDKSKYVGQWHMDKRI